MAVNNPLRASNYLPFKERDYRLKGTNQLIASYFKLGLQYSEIVAFLALWHGVYISMRHLKRILKKLGLRRKSVQSNEYDIVTAIESELNGSGSSLGYRLMHQRLIIEYGLTLTLSSADFSAVLTS